MDASEIQAIPPGPWAVEGGVTSVNCDGGAVDLYCADIHAKGDYRHIAYIQSSDHALALGLPGISKEAAEATARLIAAAPDLLALARDYRRAIAYYIKRDKAAGDEEGAILKGFRLSEIDAALAKVEVG